MVVLATLCAAEKNPARCLLPAVERYRSERIRRVYAAAGLEDADHLPLGAAEFYRRAELKAGQKPDPRILRSEIAEILIEKMAEK